IIFASVFWGLWGFPEIGVAGTRVAPSRDGAGLEHAEVSIRNLRESALAVGKFSVPGFLRVTPKAFGVDRLTLGHVDEDHAVALKRDADDALFGGEFERRKVERGVELD